MSENCVVSPFGQSLDIFRPCFRHFSDILWTIPFSGLSKDLPVTNVVVEHSEREKFRGSRWGTSGEVRDPSGKSTEFPEALRKSDSLPGTWQNCLRQAHLMQRRQSLDKMSGRSSAPAVLHESTLFKAQLGESFLEFRSLFLCFFVFQLFFPAKLALKPPNRHSSGQNQHLSTKPALEKEKYQKDQNRHLTEGLGELCL